MNGIELVPISDLKAYRQNARKHPKKQLRKLAKSIEEFGFVFPVVVDAADTVIAGHGRILAAEEIGLEKIPVIRITHLSEEQVRALRIADNRLTEIAEWDEQLLALELQFLVEIDFDVEITGFETAEIDLTIDSQLASVGAGPADVIPEPDVDQPPVTQPGDLWLLDEHRLCCGDARDEAAYEAVLQGHLAQMVITDPPYNVKIKGNVGGLGVIHHDEFVMASGEMTVDEYEDFLIAFVPRASF